MGTLLRESHRRRFLPSGNVETAVDTNVRALDADHVDRRLLGKTGTCDGGERRRQ